MTLDDLQGRIRSLRGAIRRLFLLEGLGKTFLAVASAAAFLFLVDYYLNLPSAARLVLFLMGLGLVALVTARSLARPLRAPLTDDDLVLAVERAHPALKESLISALQFSRRTDPVSRSVMSPAMVQATVREALAAAAAVSFRSVLAPGRPWRRFAAGAGCTLLLVVVALANPETSSIFLNRVWGGTEPWPARTHILLVSPESSKSRIAAGEDLVVRAVILGDIPSRIWIRFRFSDTEERGEARMMDVGEGAFQFVFPRVVTPIRGRVEAGDAEPVTFDVDVQQPPRIVSVHHWIRPPEYTQVPPTPEDAPQADGNVAAPAGSRARLRIETTKPLQWARMVYDPDGRFTELTLTSPVTAEVEFDVVQDARWALKVLDTEGLENRTPSRFAIRADKDRRPRVSVARPETTTLWITPQATLPFLCTVKDDFGVQAVNLSLVRGSREHGALVVPVAATGQTGERPRWGWPSADYAATVDFAALDVPGEGGARPIEEGDLVLAVLDATDFKAPEPNRTPSAEYRLTVVSRGKLERLVEERMIQVKDTLRKARDAQEKVRDDLIAVGEVLDVQEVWDGADREKLLACQTGQRGVGQRLATAAREMDKVLSMVLVNKLGDPEYQRKIDEIRSITVHLSEERSPDALAGMEFARSAAAKQDQRKGVNEAVQVQGDILQILEDLLERMEKWEDYNEVVKVVREIHDLQDEIHKETQQAAKDRENKDDGKKKD